MQVVKIKLSWSNVHLVLGDRPALIDTGSPRDLPKILKAMTAHGVNPKDLAVIVQTHGHADHAGCAAKLRELSDAPVIVHRDDAPMLRAGRNAPLKPTCFSGRCLKSLLDFSFPALQPDLEIDGPVDLKEFGLDGQIMPLAGGHTNGSVAVLLANRQALVGDVLLGGYMGGAFLPQRANIHYFAENPQKNREELAELVRMGYDNFFVGHGGPVPRESVVRRLLR